MSIAVWDITSKCNLRCTHCYNAEKYFTKEITDLDTRECIKTIRFLKENGVDRLHLLGGEPLFREDIFKLLSYTKTEKIKVSLTTNGTLLNQYAIRNLVDLNIDTIFVSIDGYDADSNDVIRGEGTFDKVTKNLKSLVNQIRESETKTEIILSYVMTKLNSGQMYKIIDLCRQCGINKLSLTPLINAGNAMENWDIIRMNNQFALLDAVEETVKYASINYSTLTLQIDTRPIVNKYLQVAYPAYVTYALNHTKCDVLNKMIYMNSDGQLHPCGFYDMKLGREYQKRNYFNSRDSINILKVNDIDEIFNSKYYKDFISGMNKLKKNKYHENCNICPVIQDCYPCPYQFNEINQVIDCEWAYRKIKQLENNLWNWIVKAKQNNKYIKFIKGNINNDIFNNLKIDVSIRDNYKEYIKLSKENSSLDIIEYLEVLTNYERNFLLKINRLERV